MTEQIEKKIDFLQRKLGYRFKNPKLLINALTHSTFANEHSLFTSNERLEFLGDSVFSLVVSEYLYTNFPQHNEGMFTKMRAAIVNENSLYKVALKLNLQNCLLIGGSIQHDFKIHGELPVSIVSDCTEAVIASIFLDSNYNTVRDVCVKIIRYLIDEEKVLSSDSEVLDYKSLYQNLIMKKEHIPPIYKSIKLDNKGEFGEELFETSLFVKDKLICKTTASSIRKGQWQCARIAYNNFVENSSN